MTKRWTRDMLDRLGRETDERLAREWGMQAATVATQRNRLGIPALGVKVLRSPLSRDLASEEREIARTLYQQRISQDVLAGMFDCTRADIRRAVQGITVDRRRRLRTGESHYAAEISDEQAEQMRRLRARSSITYKELGERFGVPLATAWYIVNTRKSAAEESEPR